jgi:hypothetical protein
LTREISVLRVKDVKCQKVLCHQAQEYKNLRCAQYNAKEEVLQMQVEWKIQLSTLGKCFASELSIWESCLYPLMTLMIYCLIVI